MQLTLAEMQRFFTIIILGLVASVAVLLAEVIVKAKLDHTKKLGQIKDSREFPTPSSTARQPAPAVDHWLTLQVDAIEQDKSDYEKGHKDSYL